MQIKLTSIIIVLFLVISSMGIVSASLPPQVIIEDTPEDTVPDETINTLIDTESNHPTEISESLSDNTLTVKTTTFVETSALDIIEQTETSNIISDLSEINISESKNPTEIVPAITEPTKTSSITEPINNIPDSTTPMNEPEIPSAALASGIFMVIGGIMLPKSI
jgi:hypothetical protein